MGSWNHLLPCFNFVKGILMAKTVIDLKGNEIVADKFTGTVTVSLDSGDIAVGEITVGGTTVGPGTLTEVIEDLITEINTKADA